MSDRILRAFSALVDGLTVATRYRGVYEYRVISGTSAIGYALQPVAEATSGMPLLIAVRHYQPQLGSTTAYVPGALVLVAFVNGDPSRPFIAHDGALIRHGDLGAIGTGVGTYTKIPPP